MKKGPASSSRREGRSASELIGSDIRTGVAENCTSCFPAPEYQAVTTISSSKRVLTCTEV